MIDRAAIVPGYIYLLQKKGPNPKPISTEHANNVTFIQIACTATVRVRTTGTKKSFREYLPCDSLHHGPSCAPGVVSFPSKLIAGEAWLLHLPARPHDSN